MKQANQPPERLVEIHSAPPREAQKLALVLHALAIPHHLLRAGAHVHILTPEDNAAEAHRQIDQYLAEAPLRTPPATSSNQRAGLLAASAWCAFLSAAHVLMSKSFASTWISQGVSSASDVRQGEWWRTVTALTLHADIVHLLGNLALGGLLVGLLAAEFGAGTALLLTLLGGALGNACNALIGASSHASIGASTAVFAALGVLVGGRLLLDRANLQRGRAWVPLIAGLAILGWMGGPSDRIGADGLPVRTDVPAHVLGLAFGIILGLCCLSKIRAHSHERSKLSAAALLIILSWALALS